VHRCCCGCAHYNHHHRQQQHPSSRPHQHHPHGGSGGGEARQRLRPSCALSGIPDPAGDLPPYARLSTPVYSLSSRGPGSGGRATLNLVTYASPIAIQPARKFVLGLYVGTASWANVRAERRAVLQLLRERHGALVPLLGKQSGRDIDKPAALQERGFELADAFGLPVLAGAFFWGGKGAFCFATAKSCKCLWHSKKTLPLNLPCLSNNQTTRAPSSCASRAISSTAVRGLSCTGLATSRPSVICLELSH
jgi:hypothetical protein